MNIPTRLRPGLAALIILGCAASAIAAQEYDPVEEGHALATMYCMDCHATETAGESPFATAPRFRDLHLRYDVELLSEALVEGIVTAHPEMPQFEFDPAQAAAIVAYLKSLKPGTPPGAIRR
ncbi:cytochrome c [Devosia sp. 1566]|uniref:c-type cytochrome n=1 Tax=Devosia sp. 1566 TaxID=2499144 RepID=UPI000FD76B49|nr:cytochrome c [Devosia sp. 1566]